CVGAQDLQGGSAVWACGAQSGMLWREPLRGYLAERSGRAGDRRVGASRSILPSGGAVGSRQLAEDVMRAFAGQGKGIGQRPVRQPGDVAQPYGVRKVNAQGLGNIQAVRPMLG